LGIDEAEKRLRVWLVGRAGCRGAVGLSVVLAKEYAGSDLVWGPILERIDESDPFGWHLILGSSE